MNPRRIKLKNKTIVGVSIRTSNKEGKSQHDIKKLWESFFENETLNKIKYKVSNDIYCIYTHYESDFTADYTTIIGCEVYKTEELSEGLDSLIIESGKYLEFISEGELPTSVGRTWTHIWKKDYNRAYKADFDVYTTEVENPKKAKAVTYLSIK